jgi:hypothetical protein
MLSVFKELAKLRGGVLPFRRGALRKGLQADGILVDERAAQKLLDRRLLVSGKFNGLDNHR